MGTLVFGKTKYNLVDIPHNYSISPDGRARKSSEQSVASIFYDLLCRGYKLIQNRNIPSKISEKEIIFDIITKEELHDNKVQSQYLKETRTYWEARYSMDELVWMSDFQYAIQEIEGKVSDNWYKLYGIVRGELPNDFPTAISFAIMINNVLDRKSNKYINKIVKEYFIKYPTNIALMKSGIIPNNLILNESIGLTAKQYKEYAEDINEN